MSKFSVFCYYEGKDVVGNSIYSGNHTCDIECRNAASAGEYVKNTSEYLMNNLKPQYPLLVRVVLKQVTIFPVHYES